MRVKINVMLIFLPNGGTVLSLSHHYPLTLPSILLIKSWVYLLFLLLNGRMKKCPAHYSAEPLWDAGRAPPEEIKTGDCFLPDWSEHNNTHTAASPSRLGSESATTARGSNCLVGWGVEPRWSCLLRYLRMCVWVCVNKRLSAFILRRTLINVYSEIDKQTFIIVH